MEVKSYNCPSCDAPLEVKNKFSQALACQYCGQTSLISPSGLDPFGEKSKLIDYPSIFSVGAKGEFDGQNFEILGMLRYEYDGGFWDEWFIVMENGKKYWIEEDEGELVLYEKERLSSAIPNWEKINVGSMINVNQKDVFVTEKFKAKIRGGRGELFFKIKPGEDIKIVDGNQQGKLVSIEITPDEIDLNQGQEIDISQIKMLKK